MCSVTVLLAPRSMGPMSGRLPNPVRNESADSISCCNSMPISRTTGRSLVPAIRWLRRPATFEMPRQSVHISIPVISIFQLFWVMVSERVAPL